KVAVVCKGNFWSYCVFLFHLFTESDREGILYTQRGWDNWWNIIKCVCRNRPPVLLCRFHLRCFRASDLFGLFQCCWFLCRFLAPIYLGGGDPLLGKEHPSAQTAGPGAASL